MEDELNNNQHVGFVSWALVCNRLKERRPRERYCGVDWRIMKDCRLQARIMGSSRLLGLLSRVDSFLLTNLREDVSLTPDTWKEASYLWHAMIKPSDVSFSWCILFMGFFFFILFYFFFFGSGLYLLGPRYWVGCCLVLGWGGCNENCGLWYALLVRFWLGTMETFQ